MASIFDVLTGLANKGNEAVQSNKGQSIIADVARLAEEKKKVQAAIDASIKKAGVKPSVISAPSSAPIDTGLSDLAQKAQSFPQLEGLLPSNQPVSVQNEETKSIIQNLFSRIKKPVVDMGASAIQNLNPIAAFLNKTNVPFLKNAADYVGNKDKISGALSGAITGAIEQPASNLFESMQALRKKQEARTNTTMGDKLNDLLSSGTMTAGAAISALPVAAQYNAVVGGLKGNEQTKGLGEGIDAATMAVPNAIGSGINRIPGLNEEQKGALSMLANLGLVTAGGKIGEGIGKRIDAGNLGRAANVVGKELTGNKATMFSGIDPTPFLKGVKEFAKNPIVQSLDPTGITGGIGNTNGIKQDPLIEEAKNKNDFNPEQYVKEQIAKREQAKKSETPSMKDRIMNTWSDIKTKLVDSTAPIEDILYRVKNKNKNNFSILPSKDIHNQIDRVFRTTDIAGQFMKDNGLDSIIRGVDNLDNLDQYLIAKHGQTLAKNGVETGRDPVKDTALVDSFAPKYEAQAKQVTEYSQKLLDYAVSTGLVSKETAQALKEKYPDYVPFNRVFNDDGTFNSIGGTSVANLSKQSVIQKIVGSKREVESPLQSLLQKTHEVFTQGEKNKAGNILSEYSSFEGNPFQLAPLRTAENVNKRISLYEDAKDLKPIQDKTERFIKNESKKVRMLNTEINNLEKKGLDFSLKQKEKDFPDPLTSGFKTKETPERVMFGTGDLQDVVVGGNVASSKIKGDIYATTTNTGKNSTRSFIEKLITDPSLDVVKLKKMVATRENNLGKIIDEISDARDTFNQVKEGRKSMFDEAKLLQDVKTKGKDTISFYKDGVKEIWETSPEIAQAAKSLGVQQLNILGKIFAAPVRIARIGITGLNIPFIGANIVKDNMSAFINSKNSLRTSVANPKVFIQSLLEAVGHGKLYQEMVGEGGGGTSFNMSRSNAGKTLEQIRAGRNIGSQIKYTITHPSQLVKAVEDIIARGEEFTRISQYKGTKDAMLAKGMSEKEARIEAARQARDTTVNFARKGEWGTVLNSAFLFLNANIQGTRTLMRRLKEDPIGTSTKIATVGLLPMAIATAWNLEDDKKKQVYDDIADYEKENNFIIIPENATKDEEGKWNVIKIPLSQDIKNLLNISRRLVEQAHGKDPVTFGEFAKSLLSTASPIGLDQQSLISTLTPQAIKPTIEAIQNKSLFTGLPIVPRSLEGKLPEDQVKDNTSGLARILGKQIGQSPIQVEQFIKSTFGGVGSQATNAVDTVLNKAGIIPSTQIGGQGIIEGILGRFMKAQGGNIENQQWEKEAQNKQLLLKNKVELTPERKAEVAAFDQRKQQEKLERDRNTLLEIQKLAKDGTEEEASSAILKEYPRLSPAAVSKIIKDTREGKVY